VYFEDLSCVLRLPPANNGAHIECSPEIDAPFETREGGLELYQDSSGGENWRSPNHLNRHHHTPIRFRGYSLRTGGTRRTGTRATPIVSVVRDDACVAIAVPQFWQNF